MLVRRALHVVVAMAVLCARAGPAQAASMTAVKLCGRQLSEIMTRVCHAYNSPSWDVPTVVEQPGATARRKRQLGIADECCVIGCTWDQLSEYCSISAYSESPFEDLEEHIIADRSAEAGAGGSKSEAVTARGAERARRREVGRTRGLARRRCWCGRRRRAGRRRPSLMGGRKKCSRCARGRNSISVDHVGTDAEH